MDDVPVNRDTTADRSLATPRHLVWLAAVTWDFALVGRTRMLTEAWRRLGMQATFVQVPSLRTGLQRALAAVRRQNLPGVVRPWPICPAGWWPHLGERRLRSMIRRRALELRRQLNRFIDWDNAVATVVSPVWTPWLNVLPFRTVLYDCIDELSVHVPRPDLSELYAAWERELVNRATGVVVTAEVLATSVRAMRADVPIALIRNGVDAEWFRSRTVAQPRPSDVPDGRPVVGFVGALYGWIDWDLVHRVVTQLDDFWFVFVGPDDGRDEIGRLAGLPNVRLLGPRPYDRVPIYMQAFDVCWVPFRQDPVGMAANPVKIYEYLALGKPVVTTPVADVESFSGLIHVAGTPEEMAAHLRQACRNRDSGTDARTAFALANSWSQRARDLADFAASLG
jgi:glycosyltransferase involved in cell wall biosynthesis